MTRLQEPILDTMANGIRVRRHPEKNVAVFTTVYGDVFLSPRRVQIFD